MTNWLSGERGGVDKQTKVVDKNNETVIFHTPTEVESKTKRMLQRRRVRLGTRLMLLSFVTLVLAWSVGRAITR